MKPELDLGPRILHRDDDLIVLDKPAGFAVHSGSGRNDGLDRHFGALRFGQDRDPALGHRLDRETSGCLVLGRHRQALARLGRLFRDGAVQKTYWAVVAGQPASAEGSIDLPLARRSHDRRSWVMRTASPDDPEAEQALTHYRILAGADGFAVVELRPVTGRTHQLRVHSAAMGWPIAGDRLYGGDRAMALARNLHLHARRIVLPWPPGRTMDVTAPLPEHMQALFHFAGADTACAGTAS